MKRSIDKKPTFTFLVYEALRTADDFLTIKDLRTRVAELTHNRATASLSHLFKAKAVDFLRDGSVTYWFATPATDTRTLIIEEKRREEEPRKTRAGGPRRLKHKEVLS